MESGALETSPLTQRDGLWSTSSAIRNESAAVSPPVDVESQILFPRSLDQEEMEIHQTQLRLLRRQVTTLSHELVLLQREMARLKALFASEGATHRSHASTVAARVSELTELLERERGQREELQARIAELESSVPGSRNELKELKVQVWDLTGRLSGAEGNVEECVTRERVERWRQLEELSDKVDAIRRSVNTFSDSLHSEAEERAKEVKRLRIALDNHTHDLEASILEDTTGRRELPKVSLELPPPRPVSPVAGAMHVTPGRSGGQPFRTPGRSATPIRQSPSATPEGPMLRSAVIQPPLRSAAAHGMGGYTPPQALVTSLSSSSVSLQLTPRS